MSRATIVGIITSLRSFIHKIISSLVVLTNQPGAECIRKARKWQAGCGWFVK